MKIAFYAPLKSPDHPVPSGDRLMARQLMRALDMNGNTVALASTLRSFHATPETVLPHLEAQASAEVERLTAEWQQSGAPDLWFCYHPYYKAPDLIGPVLCERFSLPYVTAEASYSRRRNLGCWARHQAMLAENVKRAALNLCFTERDRAGLAETIPQARLAPLAPFIDADPFLKIEPKPEDGALLTVAMMRPGDKLSSYRALAAALKLVQSRWHLAVIGDGPDRGAVEAAFVDLPGANIGWLGEQDREGVMRAMAQAALYVWPGHGEAYGLAYLEAQAAGLPAVAERIAGVPEVVADRKTGLLVEPDNPQAFAAAIDALLTDPARRQSLAEAARRFVAEEHALPVVAERLSVLLQTALEYKF